LGIDREEGNTLPIQKIYALSYDQLEELHRSIKENENRGWIRRVKSGKASVIRFVKKEDGNSGCAPITEHSMKLPKGIDTLYRSLAKP